MIDEIGMLEVGGLHAAPFGLSKMRKNYIQTGPVKCMSEKLLIVDQEPDSLVLLNVLIAGYTAYETVSTNNPREALALAGQGGIDLVIAGMKLPGLDGIELLEQIKRVNGNIPVIIVSSYGSVETALEVMRKGGFGFIITPYRKEQMLFAIENALAWARLNRENRMLRERLRRPEKRASEPDETLLKDVTL